MFAVKDLQNTDSSTVFRIGADGLMTHAKGGQAAFCGSEFISCLCHNFRNVSRDVSVDIATTHYGLYLCEIIIIIIIYLEHHTIIIIYLEHHT